MLSPIVLVTLGLGFAGQTYGMRMRRLVDDKSEHVAIWDWAHFQMSYGNEDPIGEQLKHIMATFERVHRKISGGDPLDSEILVRPSRKEAPLVQLRVAYDQVTLSLEGATSKLVNVEATEPKGIPTSKEALTQVALKSVNSTVRDQVLDDIEFQEAAAGFHFKGAGSTTIEMEASGAEIDKTVAVEAIALNPAVFNSAKRMAILDVDGTTMPKGNGVGNTRENHLGNSKACPAILEVIRTGGIVVLNSGNMGLLQMQRLIPCFVGEDSSLLSGIFLIAQGGTVGYRFHTQGGRFVAQRIASWGQLVRETIQLKEKEKLARIRSMPFVADDEWSGNRATSLAQIQVYVGKPLDRTALPEIVQDPQRQGLPALVTSTWHEASLSSALSGYQDAGLAPTLAAFAKMDERIFSSEGVYELDKLAELQLNILQQLKGTLPHA